jgi:putative PIN family toxin of toxin-antitoxin system
MDTCVLVSALRTPDGASNFLMKAALGGLVTVLVSVPLVLEYEAVLTRPELLSATGFSQDDAVTIVKAFCKLGQGVHLTTRIRPQLSDPADEFVLETAVHGHAEAIVTFNLKHFNPAAERFGIEVITPRVVLERIVK